MDLPQIVLGLGNAGARYDSTRHNVGFWVLDRLASRRGVRFTAAGELGRKAWTAEVTERLVLAKPRTYMNRSGRAGLALGRHYGASAQQFVVVHDDADLALGRLRIRAEGGAGGHNGIRSLLDAFGSREFRRVRLGVRGEAREEQELADYVLAPFPNDERAVAEELADLAADAVETLLEQGLTVAMNRFNGRSVASLDDDSRTMEQD